MPACALHVDRETVRIHPPLNPLPSREGKEGETPIKVGERGRDSHQGRGKRGETPVEGGERGRDSHQGGIYPPEMGKNQSD